LVDEAHPPTPIKELPAVRERANYRRVTWREGSRGEQRSYFLALRVRGANQRQQLHEAPEPEWLLCEWPEGEAEPTRFWLSTLPASTSRKSLVRRAKQRWRVERDYQEMKQEVGLDHFEGRTWRGFHHHATLCAVAHGFLALRRALFPPKGPALDPARSAARPPRRAPPRDRELPAVPRGDRARSPVAGALSDVSE